MNQAGNRERGQMLMLVLMLLAVGPLLVVTMLQSSYISQRYHRNVQVNTLNIFAADSGVEYGKYKIYNFPMEVQADPLDENMVINGIDVNLTCEYNPSTAAFDIVSRATKAERSITVKSTIVIDVGLFGNAVACDGDMLLNRCSITASNEGEADLHTNGNLTLDRSCVDGDVSATETVTIAGTNPQCPHPNGVYSGSKTDGADEVDFPEIIAQYHEDKAKLGGETLDMLLNRVGSEEDPEELGPIYIDGNLTIEHDSYVKLMGTVYVTGEVDIGTSSITGFGDIIVEGRFFGRNYHFITSSTETLPIIMSVYDDIDIQDDTYEAVTGTQAIMYAPEGTARVENADIFGSVAAPNIELINSNINYPAELRGRADLPGAGLDTVTYTYE